MNLIDTIGAAIEPETFAEHDYQALGYDKYAELSQRQSELRRKISEGLMGLHGHYKIVESKTVEIFGEPYHVDGYVDGGLNMSAASLGRFTQAVLRHGGSIYSIHAMNARHPRSAVVACITLPPSKKEAFEAETGLKLRNPPEIRLA